MAHRLRQLDPALIERYRELLHYDPTTGLLTWRVKRHRQEAGQVAGTKVVQGYITVRIRELGQARGAHRIGWALATGAWPVQFLDHINGVRDDNRLVNLREADQVLNSQNQRRAHRRNSTGLLGAHWHKGIGHFTSAIDVDGKQRHLGMFKTAEEAHAAYIAAKRQLHPGAVL